MRLKISYFSQNFDLVAIINTLLPRYILEAKILFFITFYKFVNVIGRSFLERYNKNLKNRKTLKNPKTEEIKAIYIISYIILYYLLLIFTYVLIMRIPNFTCI